MKIYVKTGYNYRRKRIKLEGMIVSRTNVKRLLVARKYKVPRLTNQNEMFRIRGEVSRIIWNMLPEVIKEECRDFVEILRERTIRKRDRLRYYNCFTIFSMVLNDFFSRRKVEGDIVSLVEEFFKEYNKERIESLLQKWGKCRRI